MYNERYEKFTLRDVVLQILFIALFLFLMIWLFPTKSFLNSKVNPLLDTIFNTNVMSMKDAAKDYYTLERLPKNVGDKVKLTLGEMYKQKLLLEFTDKYGESCSLTDSYVEITKYENEYVMKVNLKCSKQEDYILVHMGCYDYCKTTICEKKETPAPQPTATPKPTNTPTPTPATKEYLCEYKLVKPGTYTNWSDWSDWTIDKLTVSKDKSDLEEVKTNVEVKEVEKQVLKGYNVITYLDGNKPIYEKRQVVIQNKIETTCELYGTRTTTTTTKTVKEKGWKLMGYFISDKPMAGDAANKYELITVNSQPCDANCSISTSYVYKWSAMEYETVYETATTGGEYGCLRETTKVTPIYGSINWLTGYETSTRKEPVYETIKEEIKTVYYSKRTRSFIPGTVDVKWDTCGTSNLLNQGYNFTGNKKLK